MRALVSTFLLQILIISLLVHYLGYLYALAFLVTVSYTILTIMSKKGYELLEAGDIAFKLIENPN